MWLCGRLECEFMNLSEWMCVVNISSQRVRTGFTCKGQVYCTGWVQYVEKDLFVHFMINKETFTSAYVINVSLYNSWKMNRFGNMWFRHNMFAEIAQTPFPLFSLPLIVAIICNFHFSSFNQVWSFNRLHFSSTSFSSCARADSQKERRKMINDQNDGKLVCNNFFFSPPAFSELSFLNALGNVSLHKSDLQIFKVDKFCRMFEEEWKTLVLNQKGVKHVCARKWKGGWKKKDRQANGKTIAVIDDEENSIQNLNMLPGKRVRGRSFRLVCMTNTS